MLSKKTSPKKNSFLLVDGINKINIIVIELFPLVCSEAQNIAYGEGEPHFQHENLKHFIAPMRPILCILLSFSFYAIILSTEQHYVSCRYHQLTDDMIEFINVRYGFGNLLFTTPILKPHTAQPKFKWICNLIHMPLRFRPRFYSFELSLCVSLPHTLFSIASKIKTS